MGVLYYCCCFVVLLQCKRLTVSFIPAIHSIMENYKSLTANKIKIFAMTVMFLDHFVTAFLPHNEPVSLIFRMFGRIAAPVFCFFIAEGYHHTGNLKKYITRLLVFALISHLPYSLAFFGLSTFDNINNLLFRTTSVILPLAMGLIALTAIKSDKVHIVLKFAILAVCCAVSYKANWNFVAVLWVVMFGIFHGNLLKQIIGFCAVGIVCWLAVNFYRFGFFHETYPQWFQLGIFLAIPLLAMYNGSQGKKSLAMKYLFYIFYPAHLIIIFVLKHFTDLEETIRRLLNI